MDDMYELRSEKYNNYKELFRECAKIYINIEECCNSFKSYIDCNTLENIKQHFLLLKVFIIMKIIIY